MSLTAIHRMLALPKDYAIFKGSEKFAPEISPAERSIGIAALIDAGIVRPTGDLTNDLLHACVRRLAESLPEDDFKTPLPKQKFGYGPVRKRVREAILRYPGASTKQIQDIARASDSTVTEVRRQLREEGEI